jgi:DNA polymerase-4
VEPSRKRKSWSSENTFGTDVSLDEVTAWVREESLKVWSKLEERSMRGRTVTVKLRTGDFKTATRRLTPETMPASGEELSAIAIELLGRFDFPPNSRYRLAGVGLSNFLDEDEEEGGELEDEQSPQLFA